MKNAVNTNINTLVFIIALCLTLSGAAHAQSTDIDNPTPITTNVIDGEGDGKAEIFYYSFTATKGDLKVTLDAKTDNYSVIMDAALTDEDGKELLKMPVAANDTGKREVATKHFVREQKVILRIRLPKDDHLKLLTYKIKLDGAIKIETPPVTTEVAPAPAATPMAVTDPAAVNPTPAVVEAPATAIAPQTAPGSPSSPTGKIPTKEQIKAKAKTQAKKILSSIIPD